MEAFYAPFTGTQNAAHVTRGLSAGSTIRVVNFHNTPARRHTEYEQQFARYARHFTACDEDDLAQLFKQRGWHKDRPGLIPVFYEGYKNNFDIGLPLAEKYGFTAWFFVPSAFPNTVQAEQRAFAERNHIGLVDDDGATIAMTWQELREIEARGHVIASHSRHHAAVTPTADLDKLLDETVGSQREFERFLGHPVRSFAWLYGTEARVIPEADALLRKAGFEFLFSNLKLQRLA